MSGIASQVRNLRRWTVVSIFISFILYAIICFDKREVVVLKEKLAAIKIPEQVITKPVDLSGYVKRAELVTTAIKGYKSKEDWQK